jgi:hypothetical protein
MTKKLDRAVRKQKNQAQPVVPQIYGLLGIPIGGSKKVEVPNRNSYVYVRLRNNTSEVIQAFNNKVAPAYNLPVIVQREGNRYSVVSVDTQRYENNWNSFAPYLPRHGNTHSFDPESGGGGDITFVHGRQFMPALIFPSGSEGGPNVLLASYTLKKENNTWMHVGNTGTPNLTPYIPTGSNAVMVLVYLDSSSGNPSLIVGSGSYFPNTVTGTAQVAPYIPSLADPNTQIPLAAVRLVTGTNAISWTNIYDVRQYAHTVPTGTGAGSSITVQDEGVSQGAATAFNFVGNNVLATVTGGTARIFVTGSTGGSNPPVTGSMVIQDEGVIQGSATVLNFVGDNVETTLLGGVARVFITGSVGVGGINTGTLDARYLKLAADNDPVTGKLSIIPQPYETDGLYVETRGDTFTADFEQFATGTTVVSSPVLFLYRAPTQGTPTFATPMIEADQDRNGGTISGPLFTFTSDNVERVRINPSVQGTGTMVKFDSDFTVDAGGHLLLLRNNGVSKFIIGNSGYLEFRPDLISPSKEANAGKIGYQLFDNYLDIVGAGTGSLNRTVQIYDNLRVLSNTNTAGLTISGLPSVLIQTNSDGTAISGEAQLSSGTYGRINGAWEEVTPRNGWLIASEAWTRTGNHTFTVSGDVTATYRKGTKIRYKDGGSFEYGVIGASSHAGGTTTITLITNSDYAMAAAIITDRWLSYIENPEAFPAQFNFTAVVTADGGTITGYTVTTAKWTAWGTTIKYDVNYTLTNIGTGTGTSRISTPVTSTADVFGVGRENAITGNMLQMYWAGASAILKAITYNNGSVLTNNYQVIASVIGVF